MKTTGILIVLVLVLIVGSAEAAPIGTAFTYQGHLYDANSPANGDYDFSFALYDAAAGGNLVSGVLYKGQTEVTDGHFAVELDFGSNAFIGNARWLEVGVRPGELEDPNVYTTLTPRQEVMPTPYALYAKSAAGTVGGSGTLNYIPKFTGTDTIGNSVIYETSGKIGIGLTDPLYTLDISGYGRIQNTGSALFYLHAGGAGHATVVLKPATESQKWQITAREDLDRLQFWPGNVYFTRDGDVGIGTSNPASGYKLDVEGKIQATAFDTGDITFRKNGEILWRMFEDEDGLYLENMRTGKVYRFVLQEMKGSKDVPNPKKE
ncbi:MAG: hypothetical protein ACYSSL_08835, partial [Planctomycetota bacterium]